jgi:hypothetical protein
LSTKVWTSFKRYTQPSEGACVLPLARQQMGLYVQASWRHGRDSLCVYHRDVDIFRPLSDHETMHMVASRCVVRRYQEGEEIVRQVTCVYAHVHAEMHTCIHDGGCKMRCSVVGREREIDR